jgi:uncharacterized damage-inducible protein DinB
MKGAATMITEFPWFERKFTFDLPAWMYPNIVERLRGTPARLEEMVASLDVDMLTRRHGDDWSIQENAGHLWDLEALWLGRLDDFLSGQAVLREADLSNRKTHEANHNARTIAAVLAGFRQARMMLVARLDDLGESAVQGSALHPRLQQPMTVVDHLYFVAEHDDHHLAQITRLKRTEFR